MTLQLTIFQRISLNLIREDEPTYLLQKGGLWLTILYVWQENGAFEGNHGHTMQKQRCKQILVDSNTWNSQYSEKEKCSNTSFITLQEYKHLLVGKENDNGWC